VSDVFPWQEAQARVSHWGQVVLAARCARRVLPLYPELATTAPAGDYDALCSALDLAEKCAGQGRELSTVEDVLTSVDEIHRRLAEVGRGTARVASAIAMAVRDALRAVNAGRDKHVRGMRNSEASLYSCIINVDSASPEDIRGDIWSDLEIAHRKAPNFGGTAKVDPAAFGELWPKGRPNWLPPEKVKEPTGRPLSIRERFGLPAVAVQHAGAAVSNVARADDGLERRIRERLEAFDPARWRDKMARVEDWVCRVEIGGHPVGTGFLVGPDAVLTNHHVLHQVLAGDVPAAEVTCRFDYKMLSTGAWNEGVSVRLHPAEWRLASSPNSAAERGRTPDQPPPAAGELDYTLVRLAVAFGGAPRGCLALPREPAAFVPGMPLVIAQHPHGKPLKFAVDTDSVIGVNAGGTRVRYATNTEPGSSGSPVFDLGWNPVALHHLGDPAYDHPAAYNQGVPLHLIRSHAEAAGAAARAALA